MIATLSGGRQPVAAVEPPLGDETLEGGRLVTASRARSTFGRRSSSSTSPSFGPIEAESRCAVYQTESISMRASVPRIDGGVRALRCRAPRAIDRHAVRRHSRRCVATCAVGTGRGERSRGAAIEVAGAPNMSHANDDRVDAEVEQRTAAERERIDAVRRVVGQLLGVIGDARVRTSPRAPASTSLADADHVRQVARPHRLESEQAHVSRGEVGDLAGLGRRSARTASRRARACRPRGPAPRAPRGADAATRCRRCRPRGRRRGPRTTARDDVGYVELGRERVGARPAIASRRPARRSSLALQVAGEEACAMPPVARMPQRRDSVMSPAWGLLAMCPIVSPLRGCCGSLMFRSSVGACRLHSGRVAPLPSRRSSRCSQFPSGLRVRRPPRRLHPSPSTSRSAIRTPQARAPACTSTRACRARSGTRACSTRRPASTCCGPPRAPARTSTTSMRSSRSSTGARRLSR